MVCGLGGGTPGGILGEAIDESFGSFVEFHKQFSNAAATRFGSGWAWLCAASDGLIVTSTANQDNPIFTDGAVPILGLDVWEHAYYLKYQNKRAGYVGAWWNVVNWDQASKNYEAAIELWDRNYTAQDNLAILMNQPVQKRSIISRLFPPEKTD